MNRIALLFLGAAWFVSGIAYAAETYHLPEPSGPYGIGRVAYGWTDNRALTALERTRNATAS